MPHTRKAVDGYHEAWESYMARNEYKKALKTLTAKGISKPVIDEFLQDAFDSGWSLLITTFIKDIVEKEKKWFSGKNIKVSSKQK